MDVGIVSVGDLHYFVILTRRLGFQGTTRGLRVSRPPLAQLVKRLRQRLNITLFRHAAHGMRLARTNRGLLERTEKLVLCTSRATEQVHRTASRSSDHLEMNCIPLTLCAILPRFLSRYHGRFPKLRLSLHRHAASVRLDRLYDTRVSVNFVCVPICSGLLAIGPICQRPVGLTIPGDRPVTGRSTIGLASFTDSIFIVRSQTRGPTVCSSVLQYYAVTKFSPQVLRGTSSRDYVTLVVTKRNIRFVTSNVRYLRPGNLGRLTVDSVTPALRLTVT